MSFYGTKEHGTFVKRMAEGGAAALAGVIEVGMRVISVNGTSCLKLDRAQVTSLVKASEGPVMLNLHAQPEAAAAALAATTGVNPAGDTTQLPSYDQDPGPPVPPDRYTESARVEEAAGYVFLTPFIIAQWGKISTVFTWSPLCSPGTA